MYDNVYVIYLTYEEKGKSNLAILHIGRYLLKLASGLELQI